MRHLKIELFSTGCFNYCNCVSHGIHSFWSHLNDTTIEFWADQNSVLTIKVVLKHFSKHITTSDKCSDLEVMRRIKLVLLVLIKAGKIDTTRYKDTSGDFSNSFEWSLNSVEDSLEDA